MTARALGCGTVAVVLILATIFILNNLVPEMVDIITGLVLL